MEKKHIHTGIAAALGILMLILDGKTGLLGAKEGLELCIRSVIPSLFPFFVLGILLTGNLWGYRIPILRPLGKAFGIPEGSESILITSFLGGYPVGAQSVGNAWRQGQITKTDAQKLLSFCNNAGPSFLFGIIAPFFTEGYVPWLLWCIHILSAWVVSVCVPRDYGTIRVTKSSPTTLPQATGKSLGIMGGVCGWIILFRVCIAFLNRWILWLFPPAGQAGICGLLELANGCFSLSVIPEECVRFILCSGMLGFGGICVAMQTASVTEGLSLRYYFPGKLLQGAFSMLLAWLLFPAGYLLPLLLCPIILISVISLRKIENRSGNYVAIGV